MKKRQGKENDSGTRCLRKRSRRSREEEELGNRQENKGGGRKRGQGKRKKIYAENSEVILVKGKKEEIERKSLSNEKLR